MRVCVHVCVLCVLGGDLSVNEKNAAHLPERVLHNTHTQTKKNAARRCDDGNG